jgi:hypothetical protein
MRPGRHQRAMGQVGEKDGEPSQTLYGKFATPQSVFAAKSEFVCAGASQCQSVPIYHMTPTMWDEAMNADIVTQMRKEEADLSRKLQAVRAFLSAYGEGPIESRGVMPNAPAAIGGPREKVPLSGFTEQTRKSVLLSMQAMTVSPGLVKTRDLVSFIEAMGHQVSGANKVNALGALLSRSADVVGHGKSGWSLADPDSAREIVAEFSRNENGAAKAAPDAGGAATPSPDGTDQYQGL